MGTSFRENIFQRVCKKWHPTSHFALRSGESGFHTKSSLSRLFSQSEFSYKINSNSVTEMLQSGFLGIFLICKTSIQENYRHWQRLLLQGGYWGGISCVHTIYDILNFDTFMCVCILSRKGIYINSHSVF